MGIGSISQVQFIPQPMRLANSSSGFGVSSPPASTFPTGTPTDTYEAWRYDAPAYSGLYASPAAIGLGRDGSPEIDLLGADDADAADGGKRDSANAAPGERAADGSELTDEEKDRIRELEATDREVRRHEQAHMSAGGAYAGAASYEYTRGPDGRNYAVGGEVSIDVSKERDPEATIAKMRIVRSAALAPANPSGQDLAVAGQARKQEMEAQQELRQQQIEEMRGGGEGGESSGTGGYGAGGATAGFTDRISSLYSSTFPAQSSRRGIDLIA